jgi:GNAT superfamily N-acetyltransferase
VHVRPLSRGDRDRWLELWEGYLRFYREPLPSDVTDATFERLVERRDGLAGLGVEVPDGSLSGFAHLVFHPSTWATAPYCYLEDLFVDRTARGSGAAETLLRAVFDEADRMGAARTYWHTQEFNGAARSLYDSLAHRTSFVVYHR